MSLSLQRLLPLFDAQRAQQLPVVLATVVRTAGPTYSKPGALMLIAGSGEYAGLLSGGCLEGDLAEHGRQVLQSGQAQQVRYDMRGPDDLLFGLGSGCEGAMDILLQRLDPADDWQPMSALAAAWRAQCAATMWLVVQSDDASLPAGAGLVMRDGAQASNADSFGTAAGDRLRDLARPLSLPPSSQIVSSAASPLQLLVLRQAAPAQVLLLGAGPDAQPVAQLAAALGWRVSVIDHRSHYASSARFPQAATLLDGGPAALSSLLASSAARFGAAIVMSHHLATDLAYLRVLADAEIAYVGLLGPAVRRDRLLADLGEAAAARLRSRLRAPIGLDLGAATPEAIALSIIAELQASLAGGASMLPLSRKFT